MSITPLSKVTMIVPLTDKLAFLSALQKQGNCHIINLQLPTSESSQSLADTRADLTYKALKFLESVRHKRQPLTRSDDFNVATISKQTLSIKEALRDARDKRDFLQKRIADMRPWGDITFPPKESLKGYHLWFYQLPRRQMQCLQHLELPWQIVSLTPKDAYLILIAKQEPKSDLLPVPRIHMGALPLRELQYQLEQVEAEIEDLQAQREQLSRYLLLLRLHLAEADDQALLRHALTQSRDTAHWFMLQVWTPSAALDDLTKLVKQFQAALVIQSPETSEQPPTLLDQPEELATGTDLSMFYQTPDYYSWDPSRLLLGSFCVFFAMILADAGYGIVLLCLVLFSWHKIRSKPKGKAYFLLGLTLSISTIIYGVLVGSYFGITPPSEHWLSHLHCLNLTDFNVMMTLSILIGSAHIILANVMQFFALRYSSRRWSAVGWIITIIAGLVLWQFSANSNLSTLGWVLLISGMLLVLLFSSARPADSLKNQMMRLFDGSVQLAGIMGIFGDVLSYMRLFALGLASASLAITFNQLATDVYHSYSGLGLLGAILILLLGHLLNLLLSLISGVVHGLRLNFIEFYKWGLPIEGKPFYRFKRKEIEHE